MSIVIRPAFEIGDKCYYIFQNKVFYGSIKEININCTTSNTSVNYLFDNFNEVNENKVFVYLESACSHLEDLAKDLFDNQIKAIRNNARELVNAKPSK